MEEREEYFNKEQVYKDEVVPLMKKLNEACEKHGIPHMIWIMYLNDEKMKGQGIIFSDEHKAGTEKMAVLANIANDTIGIEALASAALALMSMKMFHGSDSKETSEEHE